MASKKIAPVQAEPNTALAGKQIVNAEEGAGSKMIIKRTYFMDRAQSRS